MDVKVRAELQDGQIAWSIDGKKPHQSVLDCPSKSGAHTINFHLDDATGSGLQFSEDPFWVHENDTGDCPPQSGVNSDQIAVSAVKSGKLSISNANQGAPRTLQYQLNFIDSAGRPQTVDPCIKNGGST